MKLKLLTLLFVAFLPLLSFAQGSCLTIFSEDGDKFTLYLNGAQQNTTSQTNLRLEGLSQPYYKAKIVFDDPAKKPVEKNIQVNDPATNAPADVVYRIKNKDGEMKLRYFSAQPVPQNFTPPADMHVVHYGQPDQTTVTQTTVTTTNVDPNGMNMNMNVNGGSVSMSMGGANVNMNVNGGNMGGATMSQTTTTTTTSTSSSNTGSYSDPVQAAPAGCQYPMDWSSFKSAKETIAKSTFEDTKLSSAKTILSSNCVSTDQVVEICKLFTYEQSKIDFAKFAYTKTTDPGNYFKVSNVFTFDDSKTQLNNFISNGGR